VSGEPEYFHSAAKRFCALVDSVDELSRREFLVRLNLALPELYAAAVRLPDRFVDESDPPDGIPHEEWRSLFERARSKLGDADSYRAVYDPWDQIEAAIAFSLADDVSDIYRDLQTVLADDRGEDGAWDWRFAFANHWGHHATNALSATHWLVHSPDRAVAPD
jgi:hypothetical protein